MIQIKRGWLPFGGGISFPRFDNVRCVVTGEGRLTVHRLSYMAKRSTQNFRLTRAQTFHGRDSYFATQRGIIENYFKIEIETNRKRIENYEYAEETEEEGLEEKKETRK